MEKVLLADLGSFAKRILEKIESLDVARENAPERAFVLTLCGELGAGKTTFTQALGRELGIVEIMQSPTYVLMKSYKLPQSNILQKMPFCNLIHIDAYRLDNPEEFKTLKPKEFLYDPKNLLLVEWPERVGDLLPKPNLKIHFLSEGCAEGERFIEIQ